MTHVPAGQCGEMYVRAACMCEAVLLRPFSCEGWRLITENSDPMACMHKKILLVPNSSHVLHNIFSIFLKTVVQPAVQWQAMCFVFQLSGPLPRGGVGRAVPALGGMAGQWGWHFHTLYMCGVWLCVLFGVL